jgi:tetratricopeptide (TPR) repeat protein
MGHLARRIVFLTWIQVILEMGVERCATMTRKIVVGALLMLCLVSATGCAQSVEGWIVRTRNNQGDRALEAHNLKDAALAYRLALQVNPRDPHARAGAVSVQLELAEQAYRSGRLGDAVNDLSIAEKIDPKNPSVMDLRQQLSEARLKREIVISNYPSYKTAGQDIIRSYTQLHGLNTAVINSLKRFQYSYDTVDLSRAIDMSYELSQEIKRNLARLERFRQVVETGTGEGAESLTPPSSLLPLP